ncbi:MAG: molybdopterin molybdotransferase MoeA [Deltaproteobacteria bacterium]|nr:molybdopterin molybdotransferase MoeA [Deltaproteobacteria bacterium]
MKEILTLRSPAEALELLAGFAPVGTERVALVEADGRVLAAALAAPCDWPLWTRSMMDGYAVRARDLAAAGPAHPVRLAVRGAVPMGDSFAGEVGAGEAVAITTGGKLPAGADAVLVVEDARQAWPGAIEVLGDVGPGANVIRPGEDFRCGEELVPAGRRLRPQDLGLLAGLGVLEVEVRRRPRVGLLSTGDEVVPPGPAELPPGKIRDLNQTVLAAQLRRAGAEPVPGGIAPDREEALRAAIEALWERSDAVLVSGGSSVGTHDLVERAVTSLPGVEPLFHGINVRPGKPTLCVRRGGRPLVGMPGHPVSSMVIFDVFVRPLLQRLCGEAPRDPWPARRRAVMAAACRKTPGRDEYVRVALAPPAAPGGPWRATPVPGGSSAFSCVVRADGLVLVPETVDRLAAGDEVEVLLYL